jgi:hypothetical protein
MSGKKTERVLLAAAARIAEIRERIRRLDYVCSGTLLKRTKVCGKALCPCAHDPSARHGPYYEWGYMKARKQVHRMVSKEEAKILRHAIANYRAARRLLRAWEHQTVRVITAQRRRK